MAIENEDELVLDDLEDDVSEESVVGEMYTGPINAPLYQLILEYSHDTFLAIYEGNALTSNMYVIVQTRYGRDLARVLGPVRNSEILSGREGTNVKIARIERVASREDVERAKHYSTYEAEAYEVCREKIEMHNLQMKLVGVHYLLEEPKILFFFTADNRVDFRELVKDLVAVFKTRIELRQIGIRDESRISGGLGICGREYCCHKIAEKLKPVSIKMAKDQNLSLNSMKISGSCGRLLCCLSYEHNYYLEQRRFFPSEGYRLPWDETMWRVKEINVILGLVTLDADDGRQIMLPRKRFERTDSGWRILGE